MSRQVMRALVPLLALARLPIIMLQDGRTFSGKGMTPEEFERLLTL